MSTMMIASRYLLGRKLRTFLTTLAIVFGVFVIFGMNTLVPSMVGSFLTSIMNASGQVDMTITQKSNDTFPANDVNKVAAVDGVKTAAGYLKRTLNLPENFVDHDASKPDDFTAVTLVGQDDDALRLHTYAVTAGRFIKSSDEDKAVITITLAKALNVKVGDTFKLPTPVGMVKLTVAGLMPARAIPGNEEVTVSLFEAQKLLQADGQINTIEANLASTDDAVRAQIEKTVEAKLGRNFKVGTLTSGSEALANIQVAQTAFSMLGVFALLMGGFIIFNTFRTVVAERRHDIGLLRSIGASRRTIIGLILAEGLIQGIVGTAVGMALGYGMAIVALSFMGPLMQSYIHITLSSTPVVPRELIVITVAVGLGITLVAGLLPAISASRVMPLEALRPSTAAIASGRKLGVGVITGIVLIVLALGALVSSNVALSGLGSLLFLAGLILISPAVLNPIARFFGALVAVAFARQGTGTMAQANLSRQPSRAAITASATMIGLAIIVAAAGLLTSVENGFLQVLRNSLGSDYLLMPPAVGIWDNNVGANPDFAQRLRSVPGVATVSTLRVASSQIKGKDMAVLGIDPENYPKVSGLSFHAGNAQTAYSQLAQGRNIILNGLLASQTGLDVGDDVRVVTPVGNTTYHVVGVAVDYLNAKVQTAYISQENMAKDFRKNEDVFIQLNLTKDAKPEAVEPRLKAIMGDYPQFKLISGRQYYEDNALLFQQVFIAYDLLMAVLAIPALIAMVNTLAIAVIERTREIGMLRATGATRRQIGQTILAEAVLLAAVGTVLGVCAGLYLGYVLVNAMAWAGYPTSYFFPVDGVIAAVVAGLVFGALAAIIPSRQAGRLEIIRALQYE